MNYDTVKQRLYLKLLALIEFQIHTTSLVRGSVYFGPPWSDLTKILVASQSGLGQGEIRWNTHRPQTLICMIESELSHSQETKTASLYEQTPEQLLSLNTTPKVAH